MIIHQNNTYNLISLHIFGELRLKKDILKKKCRENCFLNYH